MAKVTITIEDDKEDGGVRIKVEFDSIIDLSRVGTMAEQEGLDVIEYFESFYGDAVDTRVDHHKKTTAVYFASEEGDSEND